MKKSNFLILGIIWLVLTLNMSGIFLGVYIFNLPPINKPSTNFNIYQLDYYIEPYQKVWNIQYTGGINGITWELADWHNPDFVYGPIEENHCRYANGSRILITNNQFTIDYNTDVFLVNESSEPILKQHFQIIFVYYGVDNTWHNNGMDFRGFYITTGNNKTSETVLDDGDGASFVKATFQYTDMNYITTAEYTLLNWNISVSDYKLVNKNNDSSYFGSEIEMSVLIIYQINITSDQIEINTDWFIDFMNWSLINTPDNLFLSTNRVYTCNDVGDLNNEERIGMFTNGGITTSTFRLENDYTLIYNDSSSKNFNVSSLIENDGTSNGLPENNYWHFILWFEGFGDNVSRLEYDPVITLYTKNISMNWLFITIVSISIVSAIGVVVIILWKKNWLRK
ncbi:MAG: hypothetical protein ACTSPY_04240 [Candidatus Helarchaeota archaeon]